MEEFLVVDEALEAFAEAERAGRLGPADSVLAKPSAEVAVAVAGVVAAVAVVEADVAADGVARAAVVAVAGVVGAVDSNL